MKVSIKGTYSPACRSPGLGRRRIYNQVNWKVNHLHNLTTRNHSLEELQSAEVMRALQANWSDQNLEQVKLWGEGGAAAAVERVEEAMGCWFWGISAGTCLQYVYVHICARSIRLRKVNWLACISNPGVLSSLKLAIWDGKGGTN